MDVIGNNIANVNTAGYKTSRVIFQDIFSQNVAAGMSNQGPIGGTNPRQIGLGIRLSTVDVIHSRAAFQRTDKETDMMINGDGFFVVAQQNLETGQWDYMYTRAGNFDLDNEGYLVTSHGYYVMGRTFQLEMGVVDPGAYAIERRPNIPVNGYDGDAGASTAEWGIGGNTVPANGFRVGDEILAGTFIDPDNAPAGRIPAANITLTDADLAVWNDDRPRVVAPGETWPDVIRPQMPFTPAREPIFGLVASDGYIGFDPANPPDANGLTRIRLIANQLVLPLNPVTGLPTGYPTRAENPGLNDEDYQELLEDWLAELTDMQEVSLPGFAVADNGDVSVIVGNRKLVIGQMALAMFANSSGLEKAGNSLYRESASSGPVVITEAFRDGAGKIDGGGLEMSNVDLANEFTDMIVTQRGFQANSRIITVSDTMLEELVNLKR